VAPPDIKTLAGRRIIVTRAPEQSLELARKLEELGAEVLLLPMVRFTGPPQTSELDQAIRVLDEFDWLLFTSANAVRFFLARCRELQRWHGVPKDSAAFCRPSKEEPVMTTRELRLGPIGQISRTVRDIDAACAWYGKVLGLKHLYTFGKLAFFDCGGTRLYLSAEGAAPGPESCLYLRVDDIAAAHAELVARPHDDVPVIGAPQQREHVAKSRECPLDRTPGGLLGGVVVGEPVRAIPAAAAIHA